MWLRSLTWLDERTGWKALAARVRDRKLPRGPSWGYTTANCLLWLLIVQLITGLLLMATYSPSMTSAWASVHFIEQDVSGAFVRGVHYFVAQAMIVLFGIHVVRVLLTAAWQNLKQRQPPTGRIDFEAGHRSEPRTSPPPGMAPQELIWITGLLLIPLVLVWAVTGNPLSASQVGMAQIDVEGNILGSTPVVGPILQRTLIGGYRVGNLTLTHLYCFHVGVLPLLVCLLLVVHISQIYRHGLSGAGSEDSTEADSQHAGFATTQQNSPTLVPDVRESRETHIERTYWPYQTVRNMVALSVVLGAVTWCAWQIGAPLHVPVDPELPHIPRPEWYFLALFELRRHFIGDWEFVATLLIPLATLVFLATIPWLDTLCSPRLSAAVRIAVVMIGGGVWVGLTITPLVRDLNDETFQADRAQLAEFSTRARELADRGAIPPEGAVALLRNDPKTQGPRLFEKHCAHCHSYVDAQGHGIAPDKPTASNLFQFASRLWLTGLLDADRIAGPDYFGNTALADGDMVSTIQDFFQDAESEDARELLRSQLRHAAWALSAEAHLTSQGGADRAEAAVIKQGRELLKNELGCIDCHRFYEEGELGFAPDLTGYGSRDWLLGMISNPRHERFYADDRNDRMPSFAAHPQNPERNLLTQRELNLLVDWLRGEWYEPTDSEDAVRVE